MILMLAGCGANRKTIRFGAAGIGGMYDSFANAYVSLANKEDFKYKCGKMLIKWVYFSDVSFTRQWGIGHF